MVAMPDGNCLKLHLHTLDREKVKQRLAAHGSILTWAEDDLAEQSAHFGKPEKQPAIHVMTDAAGAMTRETARVLESLSSTVMSPSGTVASPRVT